MMYLEVIDTMSSALCSRFVTEAKEILQAAENFLVHNSITMVMLYNYFCAFYGSDFDKTRLALHRDMFVDIVGASEKYAFETFIWAFQADIKFMDMQPELGETGRDENGTLGILVRSCICRCRLRRVVLTIPITTCSIERSFFRST